MTRPTTRPGTEADRPGQASPRAWGWLAHLRDGGTTTWSDWRGDAEPSRSWFPGAQQLELLRLLNRHRGGRTPGLAERVLSATTSGRGRSELDLVGAIGERTFGAPPVDPADLGADDLLRVAVTLVAEDVAALDPPPAAELPTRTWPWRMPHRLAGDPLRVDGLQHPVSGRPPATGRPRVLILSGPLPEVLGHVWLMRCFEGAVPSWTDWIRAWQTRDSLPPRADLVHLGALWRQHAARRPVTVVVGDAAVPGRARPAPGPGLAEAELARRVAAVLGTTVELERRQLLLAHWRRHHLATGVDVPAVPEAQLEWVAERARASVEGVRGAGYPVHGTLADHAAAPERPDVRPPTGQDALDLAVRLLGGKEDA